MKKLLIILTLQLALAFQCFAESSSDNESINLEYHQLNSTDKIHRAPMLISVEAHHEAIDNIINVSGTCEAEVNLYLNGNLIDHSDEVNVTFELPETAGTYMVEVIGSSWSAIGYLCL